MCVQACICAHVPVVNGINRPLLQPEVWGPNNYPVCTLCQLYQECRSIRPCSGPHGKPRLDKVADTDLALPGMEGRSANHALSTFSQVKHVQGPHTKEPGLGIGSAARTAPGAWPG